MERFTCNCSFFSSLPGCPSLSPSLFTYCFVFPIQKYRADNQNVLFLSQNKLIINNKIREVVIAEMDLTVFYCFLGENGP